MKNVEKAVLIRLLVLIVAVVNQTLVLFEMSPIPYSNEEVEAGLTALATVLATVWATWKNNSVTKEAQEADAFLRKLKEGDK